MSYRLVIQIHGYWHPGTGRGRGSQLDATTYRNATGLPTLPGRTVKGLTRDAVSRWEQLGGYGTPTDPRICDQLFGPYGQRGEADEASNKPASTGETWPGLLRFSDATLPEAESAALRQRPELVAGLYRSQISTRIEHASGTADEKTLRGIELIVPLTLHAPIEIVASARYQDLAATWPQRLDAALPLVRAVGAHRSRGLGRATLTLEEVC